MERLQQMCVLAVRSYRTTFLRPSGAAAVVHVCLTESRVKAVCARDLCRDCCLLLALLKAPCYVRIADKQQSKRQSMPARLACHAASDKVAVNNWCCECTDDIAVAGLGTVRAAWCLKCVELYVVCIAVWCHQAALFATAHCRFYMHTQIIALLRRSASAAAQQRSQRCV
jgi:hypothetical protein